MLMKMDPSLNQSSWKEKHTWKGVEGIGEGWGDGEGVVVNNKKMLGGSKNFWKN